jgi:hypothetical protein
MVHGLGISRAKRLPNIFGHFTEIHFSFKMGLSFKGCCGWVTW